MPLATRLILLGVIGLPWHVSSAMMGTVPPRVDSALSLLKAEHDNGPQLNFHLRSRVKDDDEAEADEERDGVWYADLTSVQQYDCTLRLELKVYERYATKRKYHHQTGFLPPSSLVYSYVYEMDLAQTSEVHVHLANGYPSQMKDANELTCVENVKCNLIWLQFSSTAPFAQQTSSLGRGQGLKTPTNVVSLPLGSSAISRSILAEASQVLAACRQR